MGVNAEVAMTRVCCMRLDVVVAGADGVPDEPAAEVCQDTGIPHRKHSCNAREEIMTWPNRATCDTSPMRASATVCLPRL
jgi:hypothetical protein